ncbi:MAG: hypothetical protein D3916_00185 [Candidatus Electrothrix sp. MAN1_4]|nr:hypothetical protein [Candidatus Electrothrix sp. MAN1_4]
MSVDFAYIFPNTLPEDEFVFPLAQLFEQLFFLRPVEEDQSETDSPLVHAMLHAMADQQEANKIINYFCPSRLGRDRDVFLGLLRDICLRPGDYAGHLAQLSAGRVPAVQEDETEHSIINTLLDQTGIRAGSGEHTLESGKGQEENAASRLWQARMLLKLGEFVDRQHIEIRRSLDRTTQEQKELLKELRREEWASDVDLPTTLPAEEIPLEQVRLRLKAWSRLFSLSAGGFHNTAFITQDSDALEALLECYQQKYPDTPQRLFSLPLPMLGDVGDVGHAENEVLDRRNRFQEKAGSLLAAIRTLPTRSRQSVFSKQQEAAWGDLLEQHYPAAEHGRCFLTLYSLADVVPQHLFLETFAWQDKYFSGEGHEKAGMFLGNLCKEKSERADDWLSAR